jgi:hypothetical protein
MTPPYILEQFKEKYEAGNLGWNFINLTCAFSGDIEDKVARRAMFIMLGADDPDADKRLYWDYNDGRSYNGSMEDVIKKSPGEIEGALKLCLREFVSTEDRVLLTQRLGFIGNILAHHSEVYDSVIDDELVGLFLERATPLLAGLIDDPSFEEREKVLNLFYYAYSLESKVHEDTPQKAAGLKDKFTALAHGLIRFENTGAASKFDPAAVSFAKAFLDGRHPRIFSM